MPAFHFAVAPAFFCTIDCSLVRADQGGIMLKGSIAILSNSGGFTTTIAQYLAIEGCPLRVYDFSAGRYRWRDNLLIGIPLPLRTWHPSQVLL